MNASISSTPARGAARRPSSRASAARHRQRLLAQHVLAGGRGPQRPLGVEVVGQRDVHGLDVGVGEQLVVRAVGPRDPELGGAAAARSRSPRGDGDDVAARRPLHRRDDLAGGDRRAPEHPPAHRSALIAHDASRTAA